MSREGTLRRTSDAHEIVFQRFLRHAPSRVWRMLTDGREAGNWYARMEIEPRAGGRVVEHHDHVGLSSEGRVLRFEPERAFEYEWGERGTPGAGSLLWEVRAVEGGTRLQLRQRLSDAGGAEGPLAGWHVCLDVLEDVLEGASPSASAPPRGTFKDGRFTELEPGTGRWRERERLEAWYMAAILGPAPLLAPSLWFDDEAEAAAALYTRVFPNSRVVGVSRYPEGFDNPGGKPRGSVLTVDFELDGQPFLALNGGPYFTVNPSLSFFALARTVEEAERIARALADGGSYLMDLGEYPWSRRYAWVQDRFGVSWQVMLEEGEGPSIFPCLMFAGDVHGRAEEALRFYARTFPGAKIDAIERYAGGEGPEGTVKHARATVGRQRLAVMDSHLAGGAKFTEAVSLQVLCRDQAELDRYWELLAEGGEEGPCGWLKDRFGFSWQVIPRSFAAMMRSGDGAGAGRAFQAVLGMKKLDLAGIEAAFDE